MIKERFEEIEGTIINPNLKSVISTIASVEKDFEGFHAGRYYQNIMINLAGIYSDKNSAETIAKMTDSSYKAPSVSRSITTSQSKSVNEEIRIVDDCPDCPKVSAKVVGKPSKSLTTTIRSINEKENKVSVSDDVIAKVNAINIEEKAPKDWRELSARFDDDAERLREYAVSLGLKIGGRAGSEHIAKKLFDELSE